MNKYVLFSMGLLTSLLNGAAITSESSVSLQIKSVYNESNLPVILQNIIPIIGPMQKPYKLKEGIKIPFISISENIVGYVGGAYGKPYIPDGALIIKIAGKKYGFWENEKGIMYSIAADSIIDDYSWPKKLLDNFNKHKPKDYNLIVPFILRIKKDCEVNLENLKHK